MGARNAASRRFAAAALMAMLSGTISAESAVAQDDAEYRRVFEQVLQDPANAALNLRYARLAIERGELSRAQAAYERILERDPGNRQAQEGLRAVTRRLEPVITQVTVSIGPQWESNPLRLKPAEVTHGDIALAARITFADERPMFAWRWRTEAAGMLNKWASFNEIDVLHGGFRTGPVIPLRATLRVHPFVGMAYTAVRWRTFSGEPTAGLTVELDDAGPLKSITARWAYVFVGSAFSNRDATTVEVFPRFIFADLGLKRSTAVIIPYWRYTGVFGSGLPTDDPFNAPFPARQHQLGVRADYYIPLFRQVTLGLFATYEYRHYFERIPGDSKNRRDHVFGPGAQIIITSLFVDQLDVVGSYSYELRNSNDGLQNYNNHALNLRWIWRF
jgi:hypothetical protein